MSERSQSMANGAKKLARNAAEGAKRVARITKLKLMIADEKKNIDKLYTAVGRLYYDAHRDDPEGFFVSHFQRLDAAMEAISVMEAELEGLKADAASESAEDETPAPN